MLHAPLSWDSNHLHVILQRSHFHTLKTTTTKGREIPVWLVALRDNWNMPLLIKMWFSCTPENDSPFPHLPTPTLTLTHTDLITPTDTDLTTPTLTLTTRTLTDPHRSDYPHTDPDPHPSAYIHTDQSSASTLYTVIYSTKQHCTRSPSQWSILMQTGQWTLPMTALTQTVVRIKQLRKQHQQTPMFSHNVVCTIKHSHPVSIASRWLTLYHQLTPQCLWKWTHCVD